MSDNSSNPRSGGLGFTGALTILFVALKLTHVIRWSWWWVLSPVWISTALAVVIVAVVLGVAFVAVTVKERKAARR
jgi:ABC-type antimicrobial peptide transport system permease subunit